MNRLREISVSICLMLLTCGVFAQSNYKVKESSSRKTPEWSGGMQQEYIISSAIASDIERAKELCMEDVKTRMIDAVAQNIKSSSESNISQTTVNNEIEGFRDEFKHNLQTQSANVPYLSSISHSKVEDYYWELREDKKTKDAKYYYTIKYPFPKSELRRIIAAFDEQDKLMESKLKSLETDYPNITSVEEVSDAVNDLGTLSKYFFDDVRQNRTKALLNKYNSVYGKIAIRQISDQVGDEQYGLAYGDRLLSYSKPPRVTSNTAFEISANKSDDIWSVKYNYSTCYVGEINYIDITWIVNGRSLKDRFYIKLDKPVTSIKPTGAVNLYLQKAANDSIVGLELSMDVESFGNKKYTIQKVQLRNDYFRSTVTFDNISEAITHKGIHSLQSTINKSFGLSDSNKKINVSITKGTLTFIDENQDTKTVNFTLPLKKNW